MMRTHQPPPEARTLLLAQDRAFAETEAEGGFSIVNEFGGVYVRKIHTSQGERLEIVAPRIGTSIRLDALQLEAISWQEPTFISSFLVTPFGPLEEQRKDM
jgi:hypothetical protein